ncbi:hypothetical protein ACQKI4_14130, partial [Paenibacillus glucanolyticus]
MLNLLRKDFIAIKSSLWTILIYLAVFSLAFIPSSEISFHFVGIYTAFGNTMYAILNEIRIQQLTAIGGFVHFPASTEMA